MKEEEVYLSDYRTPEKARGQIQCFIELDYNQEPLPSALSYRPPVESGLQYNQAAPAAQTTRIPWLKMGVAQSIETNRRQNPCHQFSKYRLASVHPINMQANNKPVSH
ncbi:hypothetical protein HZB60_12505 [candidate division KSB1 bacterium]|nr:hypothetical protein [candidate division KSB1 bacterium]